MKLTLFTLLSLFAAPAFAAPSIEGLFGILIWIVVVGLLCWLAWWFIGYCGLPEPFNKVARILIALVAFIFVGYLLLALLPPLGHGLR